MKIKNEFENKKICPKEEHQFISDGITINSHCKKCGILYIQSDIMEWKKYPGSYGHIEYLCEHGVGHGNHIHGCDGCCSRDDYPLKLNEKEIVFGYKCQECGKGIVQKLIIKNYETRYKSNSYIVKNAIIGKCDICGAEHFSSKETKRWEKEYLGKEKSND